MKSIYVTSVERYSGKTATCLALSKRLIADGHKVGYLKPLSLQPWRVGDKWADEDAGFVKEALGLEAQPWEMSPVVVTSEYLLSRLESNGSSDPMAEVKAACEVAGQGKDVLVLEGGGSLREGYTVGLPTPMVAAELGSRVIAIVRFLDEVRLLDDALTAQTRLGKLLCGLIINRVPPDAVEFVEKKAVPYLEKNGISVFGMLPETRILESLTVRELLDTLGGEMLSEQYDPEAAVENLTVGAMTTDAALRRFRKQSKKAVITGGDRADIQLAALETSTVCLVLTGNLRPRPLILKQAEESGVAVILVPENTMETIEAIDNVFGKTRMAQPAKLEQFEKLFVDHVDLKRLFQCLGV
jgi:BioD-like phosphotransacetylase family protein